jgi:Fic family protein
MRIIKRKKGKKDYFYLQHSFREDGKVITREKYLGLIIPDEIGKIKKDFISKFKLKLYKKLDGIRKNFQAEWKNMSKDSLERVKEDIAIAFTYNTNAIEGSTITLEETREIIKEGYAPNKPLRDIRETESHNKVFLKMFEQKEEISEELLLNWHKDIFSETKEEIAGKYREILVRVGDYLAPDWQDVKNLMKDFIISIKKEEKLNPVELAAISHYRFEKIHPFVDGNGRIGRLLMNYILWKKGYPMLIIEYKNRKSYNKAFKKTEENFVRYFISRYIAINKKRLK